MFKVNKFQLCLSEPESLK